MAQYDIEHPENLTDEQCQQLAKEYGIDGMKSSEELRNKCMKFLSSKEKEELAYCKTNLPCPHKKKPLNENELSKIEMPGYSSEEETNPTKLSLTDQMNMV